MRIGYGYDVHRLVEDRPLLLGGVQIPFSKGLSGHSDADVLIHAIIDALLGALAKGDIGSHFPDNDNQYRGIDSRLLLKRVVQIMDEAGYEIANLDATICAEEPRLSTYILNMQHNLAQDLHCELDQVSIKATTEEGLGISGSKAGISAMVVVLLKTL